MPTITKEELGKRLTAAVRRSGKDVTQIARESGISSSAVHRIMIGESDPQALNLAAVARSTGTTPNALLGFDVAGATALDSPAPSARTVSAGEDLLRVPAPYRRAIMLIVGALQPAAGTAMESDRSPRGGSRGRSPAKRQWARTEKRARADRETG